MAQVEIIPTTAAEIVKIAKDNAWKGYRLIQMACTKTPAEMDLIYTFEKMDYDWVCYRIPVSTDEPIPSISKSFEHAFMYENEIHDLYGIQVEGMVIDFKGTLYETAIKRPFNPVEPEKSEE